MSQPPTASIPRVSSSESMPSGFRPGPDQWGQHPSIGVGSAAIGVGSSAIGVRNSAIGVGTSSIGVGNPGFGRGSLSQMADIQRWAQGQRLETDGSMHSNQSQADMQWPQPPRNGNWPRR